MKKDRAPWRGFSDRIYAKLKTSVLASLFTSYRSREKRSVLDTKFGERVLSPAFSAVSSRIASSRASSIVGAASKLLLSVRLRVYGTLLMSFGIYTALFYLAKNFILSDDRMIMDILIGVIAVVSSIPAVLSEETLASSLTSSRFGKFVCSVTGIRPETIRTDRARGRSSHGFLIGIALGVVSYLASPFAVVAVVISALLFWLVMVCPEFGILLLSFSIPFARTGQLTVILAVCAASFVLKIVRGKRYLTFETVDASVVGLLLVLLLSSIATFFPESSSTSLKLAFFILSYFIVVSLIRSKEWFDRTATAVASGVAASSAIVFLSVVANIFAPGVSESASAIFNGSILSTRLSGVDSSLFNMTVAIAIPIAASHLVSPPYGRRRTASAVALILMSATLIENKSVWAIFAACVAVMLLLMIYSSKFIYLPIAAAALAGGTALFFPALWHRATESLVSGIDNFTMIRTPAWSDAADILSRSFIGGAGFGREAFLSVSAKGVANSPTGHAYNTFLQFWIEGGIMGFVLLVAFFWMIITASFTVLDRIDLAKHSPALDGAAPRGRAKDGASFAEEFALSRRLSLAGPFCSVIAMLVYGMADYIWRDGRIFLLFWIVAGLCAAGVRNIRDEIKDHVASYNDGRDPSAVAECDIRFE